MAEPPPAQPLPGRADVVVVGGGHNGLVAATLLARAGLSVVVCETSAVFGGAARTEKPFGAAPALRQSTGAYLLGLMPPELLALLDIKLPPLRRNPHYALPSQHDSTLPSLLLGADHDANRRALEAAFSPADARADAALGAELAALREDLAPAWLTEPESLEATAERWIRPALQEQFVALCRGSVVEYLDRFGFVGQRLPARYAVTDGISGLAAGPDDPGTGHNFLAHNMCRLPGGDGTWMIVAGGMGTVGAALAEAARGAGAGLCPGIPVARIETDQGAVTGVATYDGRVVRARVVLAAGDPFRLPGLVGPGVLPADLTERLDRLFRPGVTMKVNLALTRPPRFPSLGNRSAGGATVHLLPGEDRPLDAVREMWREVGAGRLPAFPTIEWYLHTTVDGSLSDPAGRHSSACSRSRTSPPVRPGRPIGLLRRRLVGRVRPLRARHHGLGGGRTGAAAARDRAAFRHNRRPHPPRGQHVRLRRPDALCHRGTRALRGIGVSNPVASGN